jgi:drug/metabolite transporter (DMT)-like permease
MVLPFTGSHLIDINWAVIPIKTWWEAGYVVIFGTYMGYILTMVGQHSLRPTVVSIYNYVQPIVSVTVSILTGIGVFTLMQGIAVILVFSGVWLVIKSKSKRDLETKK